MTTPTADPVAASSFRDPSGFVYRRDGQVYRQINLGYREHYERLMSSGLYGRLVERGQLVPHEETTPPEGLPEQAFRIIRPQPVPFVSYPYEWSFSQLQQAALATLEIQRRALEHGMSLKDASAYNIQFVGYRPVLIDTLSFEIHRPGAPWVAYRQFCQHFLAPLALMSFRDARLAQLLRPLLDGVPLDLASALLPWRSRFSLPLLVHLHLHARSQKRHAGRAADPRGAVTAAGLGAILESLRSGVEGLRPAPATSHWRSYYATSHYASAALTHKTEVVGRYLDRLRPGCVWDLGANTGAISRVASAKGAYTVAIDGDADSVEENFREACRARDARLLPLVVDLTNPSPSLGWHHRERLSLLDRGPADLALALALLHHLAIGNHLPFSRIAAFLAQAARWVVVEFVPPGDDQARRLMGSREHLFTGYTQAAFESAFTEWFNLEDRQPLPQSERVLYLFRRRDR